MIVTQRQLREVVNEIHSTITRRMVDVEDFALSAAQAVERKAVEASSNAGQAYLRADDAAHAATDAASRAAQAQEDINRIIPAVGQNAVSIVQMRREGARLFEETQKEIVRVKEVLEKLFEYLDVEYVREPERTVTEDGYLTEWEPAKEYFQKRGKKARRS